MLLFNWHVWLIFVSFVPVIIIYNIVNLLLITLVVMKRVTSCALPAKSACLRFSTAVWIILYNGGGAVSNVGGNFRHSLPHKPLACDPLSMPLSAGPASSFWDTTLMQASFRKAKMAHIRGSSWPFYSMRIGIGPPVAPPLILYFSTINLYWAVAHAFLGSYWHTPPHMIQTVSLITMQTPPPIFTHGNKLLPVMNATQYARWINCLRLIFDTLSVSTPQR